MEVLRILHIVTYMGRGGLETMLMNYYRNVDRNKIQFDFLVHRDSKSDYDDEIEALGGKIYKVPMLNPFSENYYRALNDFFLEHQYKIVHSHLDCMSAYPLFVAKKNGVPVRIAHAHNKNQDKNIKYPLKLISKHLINGQATEHFACGNEAGKWMFSGKPFTVMTNAIDTAQYKYSKEKSIQLKESLGLSGKKVVGHVGRFSPQKNHEFLIDVFKELHSKDKDFVLVLVGGGDAQEKIMEKVKRLNLDDCVIFMGICKNVNELMVAFDVFVFPSLYEGLPVTIVEAQCSGLPCVISKNVPIEAIMTENISRLSLDLSAEKWAEEILACYGKERHDCCQKIIDSGYDIKKNAEKLQEFYFNECEKHK